MGNPEAYGVIFHQILKYHFLLYITYAKKVFLYQGRKKKRYKQS